MGNREKYKDEYVAECGPYSLSKKLHIVYWETFACDGEEYCFTLAMFQRDNEGYELKFCGPRPFEYNWAPECSFMDFAAACQDYADAMFKFEMMNQNK